MGVPENQETTVPIKKLLLRTVMSMKKFIKKLFQNKTTKRVCGFICARHGKSVCKSLKH